MGSQLSNHTSSLIWVLRLAAFTVLIGRAWQHWFWDIPIRTLFWDQALMQGMVESLLGISWKEYVTSATVDATLNGIKFVMGCFYGLTALVALFVRPGMRWLGRLLPLSSFFLLLLSFLYFKDQFWRVGQFVEYAAQCAAPLLLYMAVFTGASAGRLLLWVKVAIAFTFVGHGLYAVGYYPVPGHFVHMLDVVLGVSDATAEVILKVAGILDFIIAIGIFFPRIALPILYYAAFWGLLTALARIFAYFEPTFFFETINQWLYQVIYRLPHFLLPVAAILLERRRD